MHRRTNTRDKLSLLQDRNDGTRRSLLIDEQYESTASSDSDASEELSNAAIVIDSTSRHRISKVFNELNKESVYRLRKRKHRNGVVVEEVKDKDLSSPREKFLSRFGDIKFYTVSSTIFDTAQFKQSSSYGVYVLFWYSIAFSIFNSLVHYYLDNAQSKSFFQWPIVLILKKDIVKVALTDLAMYVSSYFVFFIQLLVKKGWIRWQTTGWVLQSIFCSAFVGFFYYVPSASGLNYPWIARVFLALHSFVFLMKMHSYGFYNGYLWKIKQELTYSNSYFKKLTDGSVTIPEGFDKEKTSQLLKESIDFCEFELDSQAYTSTVSQDGVEYKPKVVLQFPQNISLFNYFEYSMFPTLVYTLNFPRTPKIRWTYAIEKICGIFGIFFLMITVGQKWIYPLVLECHKARNLEGSEKFYKYLLISLDMIPPFLLEYLLTFFIIWDVTLNAIAELTRFSDRDFYGTWWSCTDWAEFSRIWNIPVYKFLLRHVYHSTISAFHVNKAHAAFLTFFISSIVHEFVMYVIFHNLKGYLWLLQMAQLPMIMATKTEIMRDKKLLGNVICWFGFFVTPSFICTSYLIY